MVCSPEPIIVAVEGTPWAVEHSPRSRPTSEPIAGPAASFRFGSVTPRDPTYVANYRPAPSRDTLEVDLREHEQKLVEGLIATGIYSETDGEAIHAAFMRWCDSHLTTNRRAQIAFTT